MFEFLKRSKNKTVEVEKSGMDYAVVPYPVDTMIPTAGFDYSIPIQNVPWKFLYDVVYHSDLLRTIIKVITDETFRNGIYLDGRFKSKCTRCGAEFEDVKYVCPYCGGITRKPSPQEREKAKDWLEKYVNEFDEKLVDIMKQVDFDVNVVDNGFIVLIKDYIYNKNGDIVGHRVKGVVRGSPLRMRLIWSKYGLGRDKNGRYLYVCPNHRSKVVDKEKKGKYYCEECGKEMIEAGYVVFGLDGDLVYYGRDEVYHVKRWSNVQGYGYPPVITVLLKALTLIKMDRHMHLSYNLMRSPKAILVIRAKESEVRRAWQWLMTKARENPNMIYPLALQGGEIGAKKIVEYVDLNLKPSEMMWIEVREEFRRTVGAMYGVMPLFQGDVSVGAGLNNEGLQITVTNRTVEESQRVWNEFLKWFSSQIGMKDWVFRLRPHEEKDLKAQLEREQMRIQIARELMEMGYDVEIVEGVDGLDFTFKKMKTNPMMQGGMMMPMQPEAMPQGNVEQGGEQLGFNEGNEQQPTEEIKLGKVLDVKDLVDDVVKRIDGIEKKLGSIIDDIEGSPYRPRKKRKENKDIPDESDLVSENTNKELGAITSSDGMDVNEVYSIPKKKKKKEGDE